MLNPGVARFGDRIVMIYRAVGSDNISRFCRAISTDGVHFERDPIPWAETQPGDWNGRLGIEDPRITRIGSTFYLTYAKVGVDPGTFPMLEWEPAPFHIRSWISETSEFESMRDVGPVLDDRTTKDLVLFPEKIKDQFFALVREFPSIQLITSTDLVHWSDPVTMLEPIPDTWAADRIGAGPPPVRVDRGWLFLYHANEYLRFPGNQRMYRMGFAILDAEDPGRVLYRHPEPIFEPEAPYECEGPVGNVVFGTGLLEENGDLLLYYGAGDGVIALATARTADLLGLVPDHL